MHVTLVHMPWGSLERPALGVSLLQAGLRRRGVECDVRYLNMTFADAIGVAHYQRVSHDLPHVAFVGEWLFSEALYGPDPARDAAFIEEILRRKWRLDAADVSELCSLRRYVEPFLAGALEWPGWERADLVGFTSTFEQNVPSLALAQRLKRRRPERPIVFGGANWEAEMGREYHRAFPFVDFAFSGEADHGLPMLVEALQAPEPERQQRLSGVPGLVRRLEGRTLAEVPPAPVQNMDELPIPVFDDYFANREASAAAAAVPPTLLFETSRGCWWGAKSHCTFCGLNGHSMGFRSKSPERVVSELEGLVARWPCPMLEAVDNILDMRYFDSVLASLERMDLPGPVFFEVKANLKRHHVAALQRAKILRIQPGIESLSDHVLLLMRKGTSALRNVQLLKWCREYGIVVDWNLLYGFPGEQDADYREILALLPRIAHLSLPGACGPIRLDRFSPYFQRPEEHGITAVRPMSVYRFLYPVPGIRHERIAYYFDFDYLSGRAASPLGQQAAGLVESLRRQNCGNLQAMPHIDGGLHLVDTRPIAKVSALRLSAYERCIVESLDEVASIPRLLASLRTKFEGLEFERGAVQAFVEELVALGMAVTDGRGSYLSLALFPASMRRPLEKTSSRKRELPRTSSAVAAAGGHAHG
jgi:ribosomal peptide maturation radical SAM protein 1